MTNSRPFSREHEAAVVTAHYARFISAPDRMRSRAQAAYGVGSALAASVLALGLAGNLVQLSQTARFVGLAALLSWMAAAVAFVLATASSVTIARDEATEDDDFARRIRDDARQESERVRRRIRRASVVVAAAATLTAGLIALVAHEVPPSGMSNVVIEVSPDQARVVADVCQRPEATRLHADISGMQTSGVYVDLLVKYSRGTCRVTVPKSVVLAVRH